MDETSKGTFCPLPLLPPLDAGSPISLVSGISHLPGDTSFRTLSLKSSSVSTSR